LILQECEVPFHIVTHSRRVSQVGLVLVHGLVGQGMEIDADLVEAAALLHDITKMASVDTGEDHSRTGFRLLVSMGYEDVAEIVRQHIFLDEPPGDRPDVSEAQIVCYADKRVRHSDIVTLPERFADLFERYGTTPARMARLKALHHEAEALEAHIFRMLDFSPFRLNRLNALDSDAPVDMDIMR
jgi:uncharacterized protein